MDTSDGAEKALVDYFDALLSPGVTEDNSFDQAHQESSPLTVNVTQPSQDAMARQTESQKSTRSEPRIERRSTNRPFSTLPKNREDEKYTEHRGIEASQNHQTKAAPERSVDVAEREALRLDAAVLEEDKREKLKTLLDQTNLPAAKTLPMVSDTRDLHGQDLPRLDARDSLRPMLELKGGTSTDPEPGNTRAEPIINVLANVHDVTLDECDYVQNPLLQWHDNGRPMWAQERFDALMFNVLGLKLAVPLITLGKIQPIEDSLSPIIGQPDWLMGVFLAGGQKIRTVNTARFVMPERYDEKFVSSAGFIVSIDGMPWGLAIDTIDKVVNLESSEVNWRGARTKRPWLAGTVKKQMCALIDIYALGEIFLRAEKGL